MNFVDRHPVMSYAALVLVAIVVGGVAWIGSSYFEANAYNRATGSHVSTWDAMWLDLRVQASPKE